MFNLNRGFWSAYLTARSFLHEKLRKELLTKQYEIYFTGHSLGGALTTFAAYDVAVHTIPRVNSYWKHIRFVFISFFETLITFTGNYQDNHLHPLDMECILLAPLEMEIIHLLMIIISLFQIVFVLVSDHFSSLFIYSFVTLCLF